MPNICREPSLTLGFQKSHMVVLRINFLAEVTKWANFHDFHLPLGCQSWTDRNSSAARSAQQERESEGQSRAKVRIGAFPDKFHLSASTGVSFNCVMRLQRSVSSDDNGDTHLWSLGWQWLFNTGFRRNRCTVSFRNLRESEHFSSNTFAGLVRS